MNNSSSLLISPLHSLVDWMVVSGITVELGEKPSYLVEPVAVETEANQPVTTAKTVRPTPAPASISIQELPLFNTLEELNLFCTSWKDFSLFKTASRTVTGQGSLTPMLMVISDIPEDQEDRSGIPFSATSNELIRKALGHAGIPAENIYFTYLSKWRPPGKRSLTAIEQNLCASVLMQEIKLLKPQAVLSLGESTLKAVSGDSGAPALKSSFVKTINNQVINYEFPLLASQKSEFLVKNPLMKKNFWFSLLELAAGFTR